jgi:hypothetical protein
MHTVYISTVLYVLIICSSARQISDACQFARQLILLRTRLVPLHFGHRSPVSLLPTLTAAAAAAAAATAAAVIDAEAVCNDLHAPVKLVFSLR